MQTFKSLFIYKFYMDSKEYAKEMLAKRIAGEIVLSENAGKSIQKWRNIFKIPQRTLANYLKVSPSVISDYENSRRKSPGIKVIKKIVDAFIDIDIKNGGKVLKEFSDIPTKIVLSDAILDMKEFKIPISAYDFCKTLNVEIVARRDLVDNIYGYTVIDSIKAITEFSPSDLVKLYGMTNKRALIFTGIHRGKSVMIALKVTNLRPGMVILHGPDHVDEIAKRIAEIEDIPLAVTKIKDVDILLSLLQKYYRNI